MRFYLYRRLLVCCLLSTVVLTGCDRTVHVLAVEPEPAYRVCPGQKNKPVTVNGDYYGVAEGKYNPTETGHAAAAELVWSRWEDPSEVVFAVAWVRRGDRHVLVRRYSTTTKDFLGPEKTLSPWSSPAWVSSLGNDENCSDICGTDQPTCAWFTWEDDKYDDVNWRAVCPNGVMSKARWLDGHQPSGDAGVVCHVLFGQVRDCSYKKLLAWINPERDKVMMQLLDEGGAPIAGSQKVLASAAKDRTFFQPAVAWSSKEDRWFVTWTDNSYPARTGEFNPGQAYGTYVSFDGKPSGTVRVLGPCDRYAISSLQGMHISTERTPVLHNPYGACKGIWLASSYYSTDTDRYRFHNYGWHLRIDANGVPSSQIGDVGCSTFCPIDEAGLLKMPFQMLLESAGNRTAHQWLGVDSYDRYGRRTVIDTAGIPQALRSTGALALALSADSSPSDPSRYNLLLSIVNARSDPKICPP